MLLECYLAFVTAAARRGHQARGLPGLSKKVPSLW